MMRKSILRHFPKFIQKIIQPDVSVLVPAFKAERFICDTLNSLKKQKFKKFELFISIDKSDDDTGRVVKRWCEEHKNIRSQIYYQSNHLGWVKNINFLLKKCRTKYFMVLPHDDLLHENYLKIMVHVLKKNKHACAAYSDIKSFGIKEGVITQDSIHGERLQRVFQFLNCHYDAVAFRGLVNRFVISDFLLLPENGDNNFSTDTIWNMQMVVKGEIIRVPEVLYFKRYIKNTVHDQWQKFEREDKINLWLEHCRDCLKIINRAGFNKEEQLCLVEASQSRLLQKNYPLWNYFEILNLNEKEKNSLVAALLGK